MPPSLWTNPAGTLTLLLVLAGLVGAVVPGIPGAALIWFGALAWAIGENFQRVNWLILALLGVLALAATFSEYWITPVAQRRGGYGWKHVLAAFVGGIGGGILLSEFPVIGTLFGAAVGSLAGTMALTLYEQRNLRATLGAGKAYLVGCILSSIVEVGLSLVMLALFAWRAFF